MERTKLLLAFIGQPNCIHITYIPINIACACICGKPVSCSLKNMFYFSMYSSMRKPPLSIWKVLIKVKHAYAFAYRFMCHYAANIYVCVCVCR